MKTPARSPLARARLSGQRGVALFFALICMVAIMLAAVMLVRSVDTATLIAGNLAFQQSATRSGDGGTEAAMVWLANTQTAFATTNPLSDPTHAFNQDHPTVSGLVQYGYYASLDPAKSLTSTSGTHFNWDNTDSAGLATDAAGNTVRYIIQRMCRTSGVSIANNSCLFSGAALDNNGQNIPLPQQVCNGPGCPVAGQTPMIRVTSKVTGPKNTVSYVQALIY
jgi:Tfp pilus assembly protein PilX